MSQTSGAFFSYCRDDSAFALKLAGDLKAAGANVWLDQLDILAGDRWDRAVENALNACTRFLVVLSPKSIASTNVMDEVSFALEEKKVVIPILYEDCSVPFRLRRVHYVDFRGNYDRALQELLKTLRHGEPAPISAGVSARHSAREAAKEERPARPQPKVAEVARDPHPAPVFPWGLVGSAALVMLAPTFGYQLFSAMLPLIGNEFAVPNGQLITTFTWGTVGVMLGCMAGGLLGDRFGRRPILLACLAMLGLETVLAMAASSLTHLVAIRVVIGLAFGTAIPNVVALSSEYVSNKRQALAVAVAMAAIPLGFALGSLAASQLGHFGWRPLLIAHGFASVLLAGVMWKFLPESDGYQVRHDAHSWRTVFAPEVRRETLALSCVFFCWFLATSLQAYWVRFVADRTILTSGIANITGIALAIVGAVAASRVQLRTILLMAVAASAVSAVLTSVMPADGLVVAFAFFASVMGAVQILLYALAARAFPTVSRATGVGVVTALGRAGGFVSAFVFVADGGMAMIGTVTSVVIGLMFLALLMTHRDDEQRALALGVPEATLKFGPP